MNETRECETCGKIAELFCYALPGIPMSVGNCRECTNRCAYPFSTAKANTWCIGGLENAADWWLESTTFKDGKYLTVKEALSDA